MIVQPEAMDFSNQRFSMIIYGSPGLGKTTLALSAPDPVLLDFDRGISRVRAQHRKATSICGCYEEVLADIQSPDMQHFQTVIIDTGGSFVTVLKDWALRTQKGVRTKSGEFNNMRGFGAVKTEFARFTENLKTVLNKNIIYVFHSSESSDKDGNPIQRLMCEGAAKNIVWTPCDFGGYLKMIGDQRYICFSPEEEFFAKGCHGIHDRRLVPTLDDDMPNDFITRLFQEARQNIQRENEAYAPLKEQYRNVMEAVETVCELVTSPDTANKALSTIRETGHALTSYKESMAMLHRKCLSIGLIYDKDTDSYIQRAGQ